MRRAGLAVSIVLVLVAGIAASQLRGAGGSPMATKPDGVFSQDSVVEPAYEIGAPTAAAKPTAMWTPLRRPAVARAAPRPSAQAASMLSARTHDGTTMIVQVLERTRGWLLVRYPSSSNDGSGWIRRSTAGPVQTVDTRLVVDRARFTLTLERAGHAVFRAPVGVGTPSTPTPAGSFYILDRLVRFRSPTYGPVAFGTSGRSPQLTDWPGGGVVGIHGTDQPELIPGRVSHGCIRLRNADILRLARMLPIGTPVGLR
jgi:lipoprotein-anchoring transpeptidase ErfK/SrfK